MITVSGIGLASPPSACFPPSDIYYLITAACVLAKVVALRTKHYSLRVCKVALHLLVKGLTPVCRIAVTLKM